MKDLINFWPIKKKTAHLIKNMIPFLTPFAVQVMEKLLIFFLVLWISDKKIAKTFSKTKHSNFLPLKQILITLIFIFWADRKDRYLSFGLFISMQMIQLLLVKLKALSLKDLLPVQMQQFFTHSKIACHQKLQIFPLPIIGFLIL